MNKMKLYLGALTVLFLLPQSSEAYFTTAQKTTQLTDRTILYTVTYEFGFAERDLYMPITSLRNTVVGEETFQAGYQILTKDNEVTDIGLSNSLILSSDTDVQLVDNEYFVPAGKSAKFTLVTLVTLSNEEKSTNPDLYLLVSNLPFTMVEGDKTIESHLNPSELQYYRTPSIQP